MPCQFTELSLILVLSIFADSLLKFANVDLYRPLAKPQTELFTGMNKAMTFNVSGTNPIWFFFELGYLICLINMIKLSNIKLK